MGNSIRSNIRTIAREHPLVLSAVWFTMAALLLTAPLLAMSFLMFVTQSFPAAPMIIFIFLGILLPLTITLPIGRLFGSRILSLPTGMTTHAALYGLFTGLTAFIIWILILELLPNSQGFVQSGNSGGDVPGAAIVLAYLVFLPAIVIGVILIGTVAGILLYITFVES